MTGYHLVLAQCAIAQVKSVEPAAVQKGQHWVLLYHVNGSCTGVLCLCGSIMVLVLQSICDSLPSTIILAAVIPYLSTASTASG